MLLSRGSLRIQPGPRALAAGWILVTLSLGTACGAGAAAPTPTAAPTTSANTPPVASPQRPALASPAASPSAVVATSGAATPTPTAPEAAAETYEVQPGDTLGSIANQFYGDQTQWRRIYDANKDAVGSDPDKLKVGTKLTIPPKQQ